MSDLLKALSGEETHDLAWQAMSASSIRAVEDVIQIAAALGYCRAIKMVRDYHRKGGKVHETWLRWAVTTRCPCISDRLCCGYEARKAYRREDCCVCHWPESTHACVACGRMPRDIPRSSSPPRLPQSATGMPGLRRS